MTPGEWNRITSPALLAFALAAFAAGCAGEPICYSAPAGLNLEMQSGDVADAIASS